MATRIFVDGSVYSPVDPYATALLTEDGVVRWVGSDAGAHSIADESTEVVELDGALLTPAFARALAPVGGKEPVEILEYLDVYRAVGYHTHTLLASMDVVAQGRRPPAHGPQPEGPKHQESDGYPPGRPVDSWGASVASDSPGRSVQHGSGSH